MKGNPGLPEKYCHIILDSIADGVFTVDLDFRITSFNRSAEQITGISKKNAVGKPCSEVLRASICRDGCVLKQTVHTGRATGNRPVYITRADLKKIPINVSATLLKDSRGAIIGGVETFRDLTAVKNLKRALLKQHAFEDIVSKNERMLRLFSILPQIAESNSTVLIEGASGTGKELMARAIHHHSLGKNGPFVAVNCGALPETLCESELFGYKAGAFTDAKRDKAGRFALAQDGSIFLDEVGDIAPPVQVRLLRVLEEKVYEPLGSTRSFPTNARVIAATHRNLEKLVAQGRFREDLYFRINVIKISLPALAERKEDIPLLVNHFVERYNQLNGRSVVGVTPESLAALMLYDWPGNIRELENAIEHAFVLSREDLLPLHHFPERIAPPNGAATVSVGRQLKEWEKGAIEQALERNQWKKVATARELGIDKNTLRRKMQRLGVVRT